MWMQMSEALIEWSPAPSPTTSGLLPETVLYAAGADYIFSWRP